MARTHGSEVGMSLSLQGCARFAIQLEVIIRQNEPKPFDRQGDKDGSGPGRRPSKVRESDDLNLSDRWRRLHRQPYLQSLTPRRVRSDHLRQLNPRKSGIGQEARPIAAMRRSCRWQNLDVALRCT